jgi:hypothetical protein
VSSVTEFASDLVGDATLIETDDHETGVKNDRVFRTAVDSISDQSGT